MAIYAADLIEFKHAGDGGDGFARYPWMAFLL